MSGLGNDYGYYEHPGICVLSHVEKPCTSLFCTLDFELDGIHAEIVLFSEVTSDHGTCIRIMIDCAG